MTTCSSNCLNFAKGEWPKIHQGTWHPQYFSPSSKFAANLDIPSRVSLLTPLVFPLEWVCSAVCTLMTIEGLCNIGSQFNTYSNTKTDSLIKKNGMYNGSCKVNID